FHYIVIRAFDWNTRAELWSIPFNMFIGYEQRLVKLGTNGLAFLTDSGQWFIVRTSQLAQPATDVSITQSVSSGSVTVGGGLTYTLTVQNFGPGTASTVVVSNPIPSGLAFVSATASQGLCTFTNGLVTCALGSMVNGATATITLNVVTTN